MAKSKNHSDAHKKVRSKKSKKRTVDVVSSSESDSDVANSTSTDSCVGKTEPKPETQTRKQKKAKVAKMIPADGQDMEMANSQDQSVPKSTIVEQSLPKLSEDFATIYLRKVTNELADDLDKVREANDFRSNSLPMLIHALKQGQSIYSADEKRRVTGAASS